MFPRPLRLTLVAAGLWLAAPCPAQERPAETANVRVLGPNLLPSLLEKAKDCLGVPYRRGGNTPKGFDCSGFVRFVFGTFGLNLNRSSVSQAVQGDSVALDGIQPGDLLFFKTRGQKGRISHVGIYLGAEQFIHAGAWGGRQARCVKITQLDSTYYASRLVSARRLVAMPSVTTQLLEQIIQPRGGDRTE